VLIIQLKRFEYNPKRDMMAKINDAFEFYDNLNLDPYMACNTTGENEYTLHSVVVHQGSVNSGHYYAFIKPTIEDKWILFNDETVRPADKYEVFESNFGGNYNTYKARPRGEIVKTIRSYESNAYILVYIKNSKRQQILCPVIDDEVI
jgi:ubiquitin carboxyl-terminal hydrolase 7